MLIFFLTLIFASVFCSDVIFVSLGTIPNYIYLAINQAILTNPNSNFFLVYSERSMVKNIMEKIIRKVSFIHYDEVNNFACNECDDMIKLLMKFHNNSQYYINTTKRYVAIYLLARRFNLSNFFQVEHDNMIYGSFNKLGNAIKNCNCDIAYPDNVGSIIFFKNSNAVLELIKSFKNTLQNFVKINLMKALKKQDIQDMVLLKYLKKKENNDLKVLDIPYKPKIYVHSCFHYQNFFTLVDRSFFGQFLGGLPGKAPMIPYYNPKGFRPESDKMVWKYDQESKLRSPMYMNFSIFNLHVHSKKLQYFSSLGWIN